MHRTSPSALRLLIGLLCLCLPTARAACAVQQFEVALPTSYLALQEAQGSLTVQVVCAQPSERYRLSLGLTPGRFDPGTGVYRFALEGAGGTLEAGVLGAWPALAGEDGPLYQGSQTLRFDLRLFGAQWNALSGQYTAALSLTLTDAPGDSL